MSRKKLTVRIAVDRRLMQASVQVGFKIWSQTRANGRSPARGRLVNIIVKCGPDKKRRVKHPAFERDAPDGAAPDTLAICCGRAAPATPAPGAAPPLAPVSSASAADDTKTPSAEAAIKFARLLFFADSPVILLIRP